MRTCSVQQLARWKLIVTESGWFYCFSLLPTIPGGFSINELSVQPELISPSACCWINFNVLLQQADGNDPLWWSDWLERSAPLDQIKPQWSHQVLLEEDINHPILPRWSYLGTVRISSSVFDADFFFLLFATLLGAFARRLDIHAMVAPCSQNNCNFLLHTLGSGSSGKG